VDVTPEGIILILPAEKVVLPATQINKVSFSRMLNRITIKVDRRKIRIRNVIKMKKTPAKIPLKTWLATPAPSRGDIQKGMSTLLKTLEGFLIR
jgi:hypothetical protein